MEKYQVIDIKYPDYDVYLDNLKTLSNYDFTNCDYNEIYNIFHDFALIIPTLGEKFNNKINGHKLYRVRLSKTISKEEDLSLIQTFSFPPPVFCKTNGRANIKYKSVFYCTDQPFPAMRECNTSEGDEGYLSLWEFDIKRDLHYLSCLPAELPNTNRWREYGEYHHNFLIEKQSVLNKEELKYKLALRNLLTEKFMKEEFPYHISSMIANEYLYYAHADLILYPSVKTLHDYTNFSIHPNIAQNHIKCTKVFHFKLIENLRDNLRFSFKSIGRIEKDRIVWGKPSNAEIEEIGFFKNI